MQHSSQAQSPSLWPGGCAVLAAGAVIALRSTLAARLTAEVRQRLAATSSLPWFGKHRGSLAADLVSALLSHYCSLDVFSSNISTLSLSRCSCLCAAVSVPVISRHCALCRSGVVALVSARVLQVALWECFPHMERLYGLGGIGLRLSPAACSLAFQMVVAYVEARARGVHEQPLVLHSFHRRVQFLTRSWLLH